MKYPEECEEVLGKCVFKNNYEDPFEKWLVVFYKDRKWHDTIEGEEREVVFWKRIEEPDQEIPQEERKKFKKWDENSLKQLQELISQGKTNQEMADILSTSKSSIKAARERHIRGHK